MKSYKSLVKYALANNAVVSVFDGEVWEVKKSNKYQVIIDCIESVEICSVRIRNLEGEQIGWAQIIPDLADDETVADHTMNDFMDVWANQYEQTLAH